MGRTPLLDVTLRAAALGIAAWLVAGCTWAALDIGGVDRQLPALAPAAAVRASSLSRGAVRVGDFALPTPGGPAGAELGCAGGNGEGDRGTRNWSHAVGLEHANGEYCRCGCSRSDDARGRGD